MKQICLNNTGLIVKYKSGRLESYDYNEEYSNFVDSYGGECFMHPIKSITDLEYSMFKMNDYIEFYKVIHEQSL